MYNDGAMLQKLCQKYKSAITLLLSLMTTTGSMCL